MELLVSFAKIRLSWKRDQKDARYISKRKHTFGVSNLNSVNYARTVNQSSYSYLNYIFYKNKFSISAKRIFKNNIDDPTL